jgi:hypothetical protein
LTVAEVAARLGISARAVQKQCNSGKLTARRIEAPSGAHWEIDAAQFERTDEPNARTGERTRQSDPPELANLSNEPANFNGGKQDQDAANLGANSRTDDPEPTNRTRELLAEKDARIEDLRAQIDAWRLQAEAANRTAAETSAALREALKVLPKALADGSTPNAENQGRENAPQAPIIRLGDVAAVAQKQAAQRGAQPRKLTTWQRIGARILGIR